MDYQKLQLIKDDVLRLPVEQKKYSDEFAGVYLHSNSPFKLEEHQAPIHAFRAFSEYCYPIYLFISLDAITPDVEKIIELYSPIKVVSIVRLKDIYEFNNFCINNLLYLIDSKHDRLLVQQSDGFLIKKGWEEKCYGYSWLGSSWKDEIKVIENTFNYPALQVGNGGFGYRSKSKCLKVLDLVNKYGGQQKIVKGLQINENPPRQQNGWFLAEDLFYCYFGFGAGIFDPVSLDYANSFAKEPITLIEYNRDIKPCYGFHRIDS